MDRFYHGTDLKGILAIIESRNLGVTYFDAEGVYLTKDYEDALNHGQYVFRFINIDLRKLETDDENDGFFHRGLLSIDDAEDVVVSKDDRRVVRDLIQNIMYG